MFTYEGRFLVPQLGVYLKGQLSILETVSGE